ncbi:hypothetical protein GCM10007366_21820 [Mammaliicoccus vitulinus]|nr:hypothetical protein GCM10007366_21820 [Mammaliicoccus vitulinus]
MLKIKERFIRLSPSEAFFYIFEQYDFESACLPGGMVRACSLSLIQFPRASALYKIVENNPSEIKVKRMYTMEISCSTQNKKAYHTTDVCK